MVKIVVLYGQPSDPSAFETHYANTHLPLAAKMPNVRRFEASRVIGTPDGSAPPYYRLAEIWFDAQEELQAAMSSPEGQAAVADIGNFATGGATVLIAEVD
ncbi:MAG TPA: EthD family reductase [Solirubrobacteraceae bacterium]|nr:EthD family reductase [Solirubrobacteraceae bacterium]